MTKIQTPNGPIDLGGLCLKTDTINGKPILEMKRRTGHGINYTVLTALVFGTFALGILVPACNKALAKYYPNTQNHTDVQYQTKYHQ